VRAVSGQRSVPGGSICAGNFWAKKLSTVAASPHEVEAPCEHYGRCGGCTLQDLAYAAQLNAKQSEVGNVTGAARDLHSLWRGRGQRPLPCRHRRP